MSHFGSLRQGDLFEHRQHGTVEAMKRLRTVIVLVGILALFFAVPVEAAITISVNGLQKNINSARTIRHLPALRRNARLDLAAQIRAKALINEARLNHGTKATSVSAILRRVGYRARISGELLAADYPTSVGTVTAWMGSTPHRSIILSRRLNEFGVAVIHTPKGTPFRIIVVVVVAERSGL